MEAVRCPDTPSDSASSFGDLDFDDLSIKNPLSEAANPAVQSPITIKQELIIINSPKSQCIQSHQEEIIKEFTQLKHDIYEKTNKLVSPIQINQDKIRQE